MKIHKTKVNTTMTIMETNLSNLSLFEQLNNRLIKDTLEAGDVQNKTTNVKAAMTDWRMVTTHESYQDLIKIIIPEIALCEDIKAIQGGYPTFVCGEMWGAVYKKGQYTNEHKHNAIFSFTYYAKAEKGCAPLVFTKPGYRKFQPKTGSLFIWKGDYSHLVPPEETNNLRIVIAGNIGYHYGETTKVLNTKPL
tara:strand:+ start:440 stop:1018 length:579 start_codon:yes stop_codon:yes gene_type:complete